MKRNNGIAEVEVSARDLEGSIFSNVQGKYNERPLLG